MDDSLLLEIDPLAARRNSGVAENLSMAATMILHGILHGPGTRSPSDMPDYAPSVATAQGDPVLERLTWGSDAPRLRYQPQR